MIDATCPKVGYVQSIIKKHASLGYTVAIVGDKDHPEVEGLLGYAGGSGIIVSSLKEVEKISCAEKVCIVAQTTQDAEGYAQIVQKIKEYCPEAVVFNTICSSTEQRQAEVMALADEMDAMFIVGGKNSANTRRLADLAQRKQSCTYHIENIGDMENIELSRFNKIGVSAGASTPNWIIDRVMDKIMDSQSKKRKFVGTLLNCWMTAVRTDIYSAVGAGCLCLGCMTLMNLPTNGSFILIAFLYVFAIHTLNRLIGRRPAGLVGSFREESYQKHARKYFFAAITAILAALATAFHVSLVVFAVLFIISFAGIIYNLKIMPRRFRFRSLKDLPGSKNTSVAIAWGMVAAILPALEENLSLHAGWAVAFCFTFGIVFIRSAMSDILEMQSDKLVGQETIPVFFGRNRTIIVLSVITLILFNLLLFSFPARWTSSLSILLLLCLCYLWICFVICERKTAFSGAMKEGLLETSYLVAGFCVFLWHIF